MIFYDNKPIYAMFYQNKPVRDISKDEYSVYHIDFDDIYFGNYAPCYNIDVGKGETLRFSCRKKATIGFMNIRIKNGEFRYYYELKVSVLKDGKKMQSKQIKLTSDCEDNAFEIEAGETVEISGVIERFRSGTTMVVYTEDCDDLDSYGFWGD